MAKKTSSVKVGAAWIKFAENGKQYVPIKFEEASLPLTITSDKSLMLWEIPQEEQKKENSPNYTVNLLKNLEE